MPQTFSDWNQSNVYVLPVLVQATDVGCIEELLGNPEKEVVACRSSELRCPGSTIGSVHGENDEGEVDEGDDHRIGIRA